jgi:hypothetical protein
MMVFVGKLSASRRHNSMPLSRISCCIPSSVTQINESGALLANDRDACAACWPSNVSDILFSTAVIGNGLESVHLWRTLLY